jgi:hypothetical protein
MLYNFRFDRSRKDEVLGRLREDGVLSQGWGGGEQGIDLREEGFVDKTRKRYNLGSTRTVTNLTRMSHFKDGDLLVTPHLPEHGNVSIHEVAGDFPDCYSCLDIDESHLNHQIHIRTSYGLKGNISMRHVAFGPWYSRLPWMRLPVLPISEFLPDFEEVLQQLRNEPGKVFKPSDLDDFLDSLAKDLLRTVHERVSKLPPSAGAFSFEALCARLLTHHGYSVVRQGFYDGEGGDADIVCERKRSDMSPFEFGSVSLHVQVKRHSGVTAEHAVDQVVRIIENNGGDGCVISLADDFSEAARTDADKNGIQLISRTQLEAMVLQYLAQRSVPQGLGPDGVDIER